MIQNDCCELGPEYPAVDSPTQGWSHVCFSLLYDLTFEPLGHFFQLINIPTRLETKKENERKSKPIFLHLGIVKGQRNLLEDVEMGGGH